MGRKGAVAERLQFGVVENSGGIDGLTAVRREAGQRLQACARVGDSAAHLGLARKSSATFGLPK